MKTEEQLTQDIHARMQKHFTPVEGGILIEYVRNMKTSGGVYLPDGSPETKAIAHPVISVGSKVEVVKPGQWVALRGDIQVWKMYGREFGIIRDFDILMTVDMSYIKDETEFKKQQALLAAAQRPVETGDERSGVRERIVISEK
jgi:co-chaperonin GroES (HSP10)